MKLHRAYPFIARYHRHIFYGAWLLLNFVQSAATGLLDDEAYYWVYSQFPDWGYFDHPPMVALLIKAGYAIFPSGFGVRLLFAVMSTLAIWMIEKLLPVKDDLLFYAITLSMALLQIGGIIAIPDTPLLFFTVVFFLLYKKLQEQPGPVIAILLGATIALLLYSKYHGVLLVMFTVLSNTRMFGRYHIYLTGVTALVLFAPHIYWQYINGFPSLQFHLLERNAPEYRLSFTLDYIIGQLFLAGPISGFILLWCAFRKRPADYFERALKFTLVGFYLFFLVSTLKGRVEANWTVPAFVPVIVLSHQYLLNHPRLRSWIPRLAVLTMGLLFFLRMYTVVDFFPNTRFKEDEYHDNEEWAAAIKKQAGDLPVFFTDSYQRASKYWFYQGQPTLSLNTVDYRRNNFNFWPLEEQFMGKKVYAIYQGKKQDYYRDSIATPKGIYLGRTIEHYFSFSRIRISPQATLVATNGEASTSLRILTDESTLARIKSPYDTLRIWLTVYEKDSVLGNLPTDLTLGMIRSQKEVLPVHVRMNLPKGNYTTRFAITSCIDNWPSMNSSIIKMRVE
jgi:hypothetical protein